jgi:hypothetical protein
MVTINTEVSPGDLIKASLWNSLLKRLFDLEIKVEQLSGGVVTGIIVVPDVFGQTLKQAKAQITNPAQQLAVGFIIDAFGNNIDDSNTATDSLIVIGQMPPAGTRTNPASSVNLAVSASSTVVEPPQPPKINPNGFSPKPVPAGTEVTIGGENFAALAGDNKITFDGVAAAVSSGGPTFLKVVVPKNLPNGPTKVGDPTNNNVKVHLNTGKGETDAICSVSAPISESPSPFINTITPSPGQFTTDLIINGTGFTAATQDHRVTFSGKPGDGVAPKTATPTTLTVTIPDSLKSEFTTVPSMIQFDVVVTTKGVKSNTKPHNILRVT